MNNKFEGKICYNFNWPVIFLSDLPMKRKNYLVVIHPPHLIFKQQFRSTKQTLTSLLPLRRLFALRRRACLSLVRSKHILTLFLIFFPCQVHWCSMPKRCKSDNNSLTLFLCFIIRIFRASPMNLINNGIGDIKFTLIKHVFYIFKYIISCFIWLNRDSIYS